ncbi:MAG: ubiquinol-cytochrome c reductase iron-sulfur subunit [Pyrinomonadaceae bacterium]
MSVIPGDTIKKVLSDERDVREATEPYQAEFPYGRDDESQVTRREFCNFLFLTSSALLAATGGFAAKSVYDASRESHLAPMQIDGAMSLKPGSALNFHYPNENDTAILIRTLDGNYYAYGQKCTHLTCPVYYDKQDNRLECPCHEGGFAVETGQVLYGPPPRPLDKVEIEVRPNGEVWAVNLIRGGGEHGPENV